MGWGEVWDFEAYAPGKLESVVKMAFFDTFMIKRTINEEIIKDYYEVT